VLSFFPVSGFLGTGATFGADLNLLVQLIMGVSLIVGTLLAKRKRYRAHGICQTTVLLLNLLMIGLASDGAVVPATSEASTVQGFS
jgi:Ca2+/H+ antiporter